MEFFRKIIIMIILAVISLAFASSSLAKGSLSTGIKDFKDTVAARSGLTEDGTKDLQSIVGRGINIALTVVGLIFLILMVYAGYLWMTARGEEDQIKTAQKIITAAVIGLVIVVSAYAITYLVTSRFETPTK